MPRAYVLSPKLSDLSTYTASNSVTNAVASNVRIARPFTFWRSTSTTPWLKGNFGTPRTVNTVSLGYINAQASDTVRIRLASSDAGLTSSPGYDSNVEFGSPVLIIPAGVDSSAYRFVHRSIEITSQTFQWFQLDFGFGSNSDGYVQLSRAMLGERIEPLTSIKTGWKTSLIEPVVETTDLGGEESSRPTGAKRSVEAEWHNLTESERDSLYAMLIERGSSKDFTFVIDPQGPMAHIHIGRNKSPVVFPKIMNIDSGEVQYSHALQVSEMAPLEML